MILLAALASPAAHAAVSIDQTPLTVQKPLAPNIVLMLDDSGSMAWDYMPDWEYIGHCSGGSCDPTLDELRDASINGTYYNPAVIYTPPPKADGSDYPDSPGLGDAYTNGFTDLTTTDITQYYSPSAGTTWNGEPKFPYYRKFDSVNVPLSYAPAPGCAPGDRVVTDPDSSHSGAWCAHTETVQNPPVEPVCKKHIPGFLRWLLGGLSCSARLLVGTIFDPASVFSCTGVVSGTLNWVAGLGWRCISYSDQTTYPYRPDLNQYPTCNSGGSYDANSGLCTGTETRSAQLFEYEQRSGDSGSTTFVHHYVGKSEQDCQVALAADTSDGVTCDASTPTRQNVANWFSYYRTRMLLAKSGLMIGFSHLDPSSRLGFGSINRNNKANLPAPTYYSDRLTGVKPFGDGAADTQKSAFWNWIVGESPNGGTPLRAALRDVGKYYEHYSQPWQTSETDTTTLACRQSYAILTTDGFWNGNMSTNFGNQDGTDGAQVDGANGQTYKYKAAPPYSDRYSNTLADVSMFYWQHDLQSSIPNEVPTSSEDPAFWQHMTTFTLGMGFTPVNITGTASDGTSPPRTEQIFDWANGGNPISNFSWPRPAGSGNNGGSINNIADLVHAAVNGHGGFYSATSPQTFASAIRSALTRVAERVGTGASLAANSTKLQTGTVTYQALYYTGKWKGDLKAFTVDPNNGEIGAHASWAASQQLPAWDTRNIKTCKPSGTGACTDAVAFSTASALSADEQTALGGTAASQQAIIDYLRGDPGEEQQNNGDYRSRDTALGDIVDSQPVFVGAPNPNTFQNESFNGSGSYAAFASAQMNRAAAIWVAANDGMIHEFDAATGAELYAYLPAAVIMNGIAKLADPNYGISVPHQYYNDGQLTIADVYLGGSWKSVLVGTTGRGPVKAVYALDVTNPASPSLLWERSAGDGGTGSNHIGQIAGKPVVAQTANGTWSVLIGNGYNSAAGTADLLQFNIATGALTVYPTDSSGDNGLAAPAVWIGTVTNDVSTTAYAGDLDGHVWSFDLTTPGSAGKLLFTAKDASGTPQPITAGMLAGMDPKTQDRWLFFGTGRYLAQSDLDDKSVQSWYGIIVKPGPAQPQDLTTRLSNGRSALRKRSILAEVAPDQEANPPTLGGRVVSLPSDDGIGSDSGWYMDLESPTGDGGSGVAQGERMVLPNQFQGSLLLGTTRVPVASDPCNPSGAGWIMAINPFTGTNPASPFFDLNHDRKFTDADKISYASTRYASAGVGFNSVPNAPIFVGNTMLTSFDNASTSSIDTSGTVGAIGRISWRELIKP